jgi:S1-C subfamily serine protease
VRRVRAALAALLAAGALAVGACGGDDSGSDGSGATASSDSPQTTVAIQARSGDFNPAAVYKQAAPGVVTIRSIFPGGATSLLGGGGSAAQGTGFVISEDGEIATNAHVVTDAVAGGGAGTIHEAKEVYVQFADRNQVAAEIVGFDPNSDVALLKVDPQGLDLRPLELARDEQVQVGEPVAVIGSPFEANLTGSLSVGVVSATDRAIPSLTRFQIDGGIQTDASINPGNSGGPLLDAEARVIGINEQLRSNSGGNEGVAFAVPITLAADALDQLRDDGSVRYAYIGVTTQALYPQLADRLGLNTDAGALVTDVVDGSPAAEAGIEAGNQEIQFQTLRVPTGGDVIVAVDGAEIVDETALPTLIAQHDPGDQVTIEVIRDGETRRLDVTLGERPENVR